MYNWVQLVLVGAYGLATLGKYIVIYLATF
jgi:hypothetical protein